MKKNTIKFIKKKVLTKAFENNKRLYLCGDLKLPQPALEPIFDEKSELGISEYKEYTSEKPHFHKLIREYNYVLEGKVKVYIFDENKEYLFEKGDLFVIDKNTKYMSKSLAGTKILFVKVPGCNDKVLLEMDSSIKKWSKSWE